MTTRPPARIGDAVAAIDTPALVVDLDALERNLDLMANAIRGAGVALRPHAKSHKCVEIARMQIERDAVGHLLPEGERSGSVRRRRHPRRARHQRDRRRGEARAAGGARAAGDDRRARRRCGQRGGALGGSDGGGRDARCAGRGRRRARIAAACSRASAAARLAAAIARSPGLRLRGLHAYQGGAQHLRTPDERRAAIADAVRLAALSKDGDRARGTCVARSSPAPAPAPGSSSATAASTPRCSRAPTSSWTPITVATRWPPTSTTSSRACTC